MQAKLTRNLREIVVGVFALVIDKQLGDAK